MASLRIAIVGAECTGKSELALALAGHFAAQGRSIHIVPEYLREWCDTHKRTPLAHEQAGIATEQARRTLAAPCVDVLIADTTGLMTAVYSDVYFGDKALYPASVSHQQLFDLTLLTNTDLPWRADGIQRDGIVQQQSVDKRLREVLTAERLSFYEILGLERERLNSVVKRFEAHTD